MNVKIFSAWRGKHASFSLRRSCPHHLRTGGLFCRQDGKSYAWYNFLASCLPPNLSRVMMLSCHAINVSQSDFTGNYVNDSRKDATKNKILAEMSAKSDFIHTIRGISANPVWQLVPFLLSNHQGTKNFEIKSQKRPNPSCYHQAQSTVQWTFILNSRPVYMEAGNPPWWCQIIACVYIECYQPGVPGNVFLRKMKLKLVFFRHFLYCLRLRLRHCLVPNWGDESGKKIRHVHFCELP